MDIIRDTFSEHSGTAKGLAGAGVGFLLSYVTPVLTVVVLLLTIYNLILEIRKRRKED